MKVKRTEEVDVQQFRVGDIIHFELSDGEKVEMLAVKEEDEGMIFCSSDCLEKECRMNRKNTNAGGWDASYLRKKLNGEILDRFPQEIREQMLPFENGDLLRLPTEKEIFGKNPYGDEESEDVTQWEPMKRRKNRMASQGLNSGLMWYWLKKPKRKTVDSFMGVNSHGNEAKSNGSLALGVRPVLKIKNPMSAPATQCPDYFDMGTMDKALVATNIQADATMDAICANGPLIQRAWEDAEEDDGYDTEEDTEDE